jgi:hypothetical protein
MAHCIDINLLRFSSLLFHLRGKSIEREGGVDMQAKFERFSHTEARLIESFAHSLSLLNPFPN